MNIWQRASARSAGSGGPVVSKDCGDMIVLSCWPQGRTEGAVERDLPSLTGNRRQGKTAGKSLNWTRQGSAEPWRVQFNDFPAVLPCRRLPVRLGRSLSTAPSVRPCGQHESTIMSPQSFETTGPPEPAERAEARCQMFIPVAASADPKVRFGGFL